MNSVFSAFKSNSSSSATSVVASSNSSSVGGVNHNNNNTNNNGHHTVGLIDGKPLSSKYAGKKIHTQDCSSYENLRHIREIESCTQMSSFVDVAAVTSAAAAACTGADDDDDDDNTTSSCSSNHTIRLGKRCVTPVVVSSAVIELAADEDLDDDLVATAADDESVDTVDFVARSSERPDDVDCSDGGSATKAIPCDSDTNPKSCGSFDNVSAPSPPVSAKTIFSSEGDLLNGSSSISTTTCAQQPSECTVSALNISSSHAPMLPPSSAAAAAAAAAAQSSSHAPIIVANSRGHSESNLSATKTTNRFQKRLSLSGFTNNSMPSVHGRPTSASSGCAPTAECGTGAGGTNGSGEVKRTRLSTHQRNLSLDFR